MEKEFEEKLKFYKLDPKNCEREYLGKFDVIRQDIDWSGMELKDMPFDNIGVVENNFDISRNTIKVFNGSPSKIKGYPNFSLNIDLNSLDYAPELYPEKYSTDEAFDWLFKRMRIETSKKKIIEINLLTGDSNKWGIMYLKLCFKATDIDEDMLVIYHYANVYKTWSSWFTFDLNIEYLYREFQKKRFDFSLLKSNKYFPRIDGINLANDINII